MPIKREDIIEYPELLRLQADGLTQWLQEQIPVEQRDKLHFEALKFASEVLTSHADWADVRLLAEYGHNNLLALADAKIPDDLIMPEVDEVPEPDLEPEPEPEPVPDPEPEELVVGA